MPTPDNDSGVAVVEHLTDLGNARRLVVRHGTDLRYCHTWKRWLAWDTRRWMRDDSGEAARRAKAVVRMIYGEASDIADEEQRKMLAKHATRCEADVRCVPCWPWRKVDQELVVRPDDLDTDVWLLNVLNGTLDLRTATLHPHRQEDLVARLVPVAYDASADAPTWAAFLPAHLRRQCRLDRVCATRHRLQPDGQRQRAMLVPAPWVGSERQEHAAPDDYRPARRLRDLDADQHAAGQARRARRERPRSAARCPHGGGGRSRRRETARGGVGQTDYRRRCGDGAVPIFGILHVQSDAQAVVWDESRPEIRRDRPSGVAADITSSRLP